MKINKIEIENFRSIADRVRIFPENSQMQIFVGPNSIGKSNVLRAINLFLNGETEPGQPYLPKDDGSNISKKFPIISIEFQFESSEDKKLVEYINKNHSGDFPNLIVPVTLRCLASGKTTYSFTGAKGRRKTLNDLLELILDYVNCIYIPAIKDYKTIIGQEMTRKIVSATFQGFGKGKTLSGLIGKKKQEFQAIIKGLQSVLDGSSDFVSLAMKNVVDSIERFSFLLPYDNLEAFLGKLDFQVKEKRLDSPVHLGCQGSGIQSLTIYLLLRLLHELQPKNTTKKSKFIWLIEEPETFMHHDLQRKTFETLQEYSKEGYLFLSTHSPVFISKNRYSDTYEVYFENSTKLRKMNSKSVVALVLGSLGVSVIDFGFFGRNNVLVEGETDKQLLIELAKLFRSGGDDSILDPEEVHFVVCNSASSVSFFYQTYSVFERFASFICLFDRDKSGIDARQKLIDNKVDPSKLVLIPTISYKDNPTIEDLVDKSIWDKILGELDASGLVELHKKKGNIVGYGFEFKNRTSVKKLFTDKLINYAKTDLSGFEHYRNLLISIKAALS